MNIPLFITFRLFFNARFYYPVFAVLQLDYGLTIEQFAWLNVIWAITIILLEVPSGALADHIGRQNMIILASCLMIAEMALIAFVPLGNPDLVFSVFILNRILSGAAEAAASGADEALAYDSLPETERKNRWPHVLNLLMKCQSIAFVIAMVVGGAVYDASFINSALSTIGFDSNLNQETAIRLPIILTLFSSFICLTSSLMMKEPKRHSEKPHTLWSGIISAGSWILKTPLVLAIILTALVHDTLIRMILCLNSEYYRIIHLPEASFGIIGAGFAGLGILTSSLAKHLIKHYSMVTNTLLISTATFLGLLGISLTIPYYGVVPMIFLSIGFSLLNFFTSHYLNNEVDSKHRATVLSFKGLALNLGFATLSFLYGILIIQLKNTHAPDTAFAHSLFTFPPLLLVALLGLTLYYLLKVRP